MAQAWRPVSPARISLLIETNSLFLITGNPSLRLRKRLEISVLVTPGEPNRGEFPCIFPGDQGIGRRDEFSLDSPHQLGVRSVRFGRLRPAETGTPITPSTSWESDRPIGSGCPGAAV
jgi:hypothetical protein